MRAFHKGRMKDCFTAASLYLDDTPVLEANA